MGKHFQCPIFRLYLEHYSQFHKLRLYSMKWGYSMLNINCIQNMSRLFIGISSEPRKVQEGEGRQNAKSCICIPPDFDSLITTLTQAPKPRGTQTTLNSRSASHLRHALNPNFKKGKPQHLTLTPNHKALTPMQCPLTSVLDPGRVQGGGGE